MLASLPLIALVVAAGLARGAAVIQHGVSIGALPLANVAAGRTAGNG